MWYGRCRGGRWVLSFAAHLDEPTLCDPRCFARAACQRYAGINLRPTCLGRFSIGQGAGSLSVTGIIGACRPDDALRSNPQRAIRTGWQAPGEAAANLGSSR